MNVPASKTPTLNAGVIVIVALLLIGGGFLISLLTPALLPPERSAEAAQVDALFRVLLGIGGAIFLLVQGALLHSVLRFRAKAGDTGDGVPLHGNNLIEVVWTLIPAVIVTGLAIYSFIIWQDIRAPKPNEVVIGVKGAQFAWQFTYLVDDPRTPETDATLAVTDSNLYLVVNKPVLLQMTTQDVIHAFWVPDYRIKQDLLPGRTTEIRFTPTSVTPRSPDGVIYSQNGSPVRCAELCGGGHGNMSLLSYVVVLEQVDFDGWLARKVDAIVNPPADPVLRGQQVLAQGPYACKGCHVLPLEGWVGVTGPNLTGVGDRAGRRVAGMSPETYLVHSIRLSQEYIVPGYGAGVMPVFQNSDPAGANYMPDEDLLAIVSYLCTQTATGDNACDPQALQDAVDALNTGG